MGGKDTNTHSILKIPPGGYRRRESLPDFLDPLLDRLLELLLERFVVPPLDLLLDVLLRLFCRTFGLDCLERLESFDFREVGFTFGDPSFLVEGLGRTAVFPERPESPDRDSRTEPLEPEPSLDRSPPDRVVPRFQTRVPFFLGSTGLMVPWLPRAPSLTSPFTFPFRCGTGRSPRIPELSRVPLAEGAWPVTGFKVGRDLDPPAV